MVAISKFNKNKLNSLGLTGTVKNQKEELKTIIKILNINHKQLDNQSFNDRINRFNQARQISIENYKRHEAKEKEIKIQNNIRITQERRQSQRNLNTEINKHKTILNRANINRNLIRSKKHLDDIVSAIKNNRSLDKILPPTALSKKQLKAQASIARAQKYIYIVEAYVEYDGIGGGRQFNYVPVEIESASVPTNQQIVDGFMEHINAIGGGHFTYNQDSISNFRVVSTHTRESVPMRQNLKNSDCVVEALYNVVIQDSSEYSKESYYSDFYRFCAEINPGFSRESGVNTETLMNFIREKEPRVSAIILDSLSQPIAQVIASDRRGGHLYFGGIQRCEHLEPITDYPTIKKLIHNKFNHKKNASELIGTHLVADFRNHIYLEFEKCKSPMNTLVVKNPELIDFTVGSENQVVITNVKLPQIVKLFQERHNGIMIPAISISQKMWKNPLNGSIWVSSDDYNNRKTAFETISQIEGVPDIKEFKNFTYNSLSNQALNLYQARHGSFQKSYIRSDIWDLKRQFAPKPNSDIIAFPLSDSSSCNYTVDISSSYFNGIQNGFQGEYLPIYDGLEVIQKFSGKIQPGEYFVRRYGCDKKLTFRNQWVNSIALKKMAKNGWVKREDIILEHVANQVISTESFISFSKYLFDTFPKAIAKGLFCQWYGTLNSTETTKDIGSMTDSWIEVSSLINEYGTENLKLMEVYADCWAVSLRKKTPNHYNNSPIFNAIICMGQINLMELFNHLKNDCKVNPGSIYSYMTDSISFSNYIKPEIDLTKYKFDKYKPRNGLLVNRNKGYDPCAEDSFMSPFSGLRPISLEFDASIDNQKSFLLPAEPGLGKTWHLINHAYKLEQLGKSYMILTPTNGARLRITDTNPTLKCKTIASFLGMDASEFKSEEDRRNYVIPSVEYLKVDEYSLIKPKVSRQFLEYRRKHPDVIIQIYGDDDQCKNVSDNSRLRVRENDAIIKYLCGGNLRHISPHSKMRCDMKLFNALGEWRKTGIIPEVFAGRRINLDNKLTLTTRINDNEIWNKKFNPDGVQVGSEIMVMNNTYRKDSMYNGMRFKVASIEGHSIKLEGSKNSYSLKHFALCNGITVYKAQGTTITESFNCILNRDGGHLCNLEEALTMFSRAKNFDDICFDYSKFAGKKFYSFYEREFVPTFEKLKPVGFGGIYQGINEMGDSYIGQADDEEKRIKGHHKDARFDGMKFELLYKCFKHNMDKYEKMEIIDSVRSGKYRVLNKNFNEEMTIGRMTEVLISESVVEKSELRSLPKGISAYKYGFQVDVMIGGKKHKRKSKDLEECIQFLKKIRTN